MAKITRKPLVISDDLFDQLFKKEEPIEEEEPEFDPLEEYGVPRDKSKWVIPW